MMMLLQGINNRPRQRFRTCASSDSGINAEIACFLDAVTALHRACCDPLIAPWSEHFYALDAVNQAICPAIRTITDKDVNGKVGLVSFGTSYFS
jgi:hypothetical protein